MRQGNERVQVHGEGGKERWRDVVGYEGLYRVSDWGRVKSLRKWKNYRGNSSGYWMKGGVKKLTFDGIGRVMVNLTKNGGHRTAAVHRLVLDAFVGPCPEGMEGCHADGNCQNNHLNNLRWDTHSENEKDKFNHGTSHFCGENHYGAKLTEESVREIRKLRSTGKYSLSQLARMFGVAVGTIQPIVQRKTWKYVV